MGQDEGEDDNDVKDENNNNNNNKKEEEPESELNYDMLVHELASDRRAHATDRTKTEAELAQEEKEKLERAEVNMTYYGHIHTHTFVNDPLNIGKYN